MTTRCNDLTMDELLRDGVTQAVMRADRVDPAELAAMLRSVASTVDLAALAPRTPAARGAVGWLLAPFDRRAGNDAGCFAAGSRLRSQFCGAP